MYNPQEIANNIKSIAKQQHKPIGTILSDCKLSKNALSSMNQGYMPHLENLLKIADYLSCSVDDLIGRSCKKDNSTSICKDRSAVIEKINSLSDSQLDKLLGYLDGLLSSE